MATEFTPGPVATKAVGYLFFVSLSRQPPDAVVQVKSEDLVPSADGVGEIMLCIDSQFRPPCTTALHLESTCTNVPVNFNDNVSAVRPVQGVVCTLYADVNCGGQNILSIYPGYPDLATQGFNDRLTAYICT
ncbi:hypothetical protein FB451DRAFT_1026068 [Mycena latifolia]|nr:hypothetical protein FB451DRAFT_1026068 [Mycena latifolia]